MFNKNRWSNWPLIAAPAIPLMVFMPQAEHRLVAAGLLSWGAVAVWHQAKRYHRKSRLLWDAFDRSGQSVIALHSDFTIASVNRHFGENTGFTEDSIAGKHVCEVLSPRYSREWVSNLFQAVGHKPCFTEGKLWMRRINGEEFPEFRYIAKAEDEDTGIVSGYLLIGYSVEQEEQHNALLVRRQQLDPLTSLQNRSRLQGLLSFILPKFTSYQNTHDSIDVALIDIDDFQMVNQSLGGPEGDRLLIQVAERLQGLENAVVGRLGGDEFLVITSSSEKKNHAYWQQALQKTLVQPYQLQAVGGEVHLSFTIASTRASDQDGLTDGCELLQMLEQTMLRAKLGGGNHIEHYDPGVDVIDEGSLLLINELRKAVKSGSELQLHYQTQNCMRTGRIQGVEALLRWCSKVYGPVSPELFIPLAENHGLIDELGAWVINEASRQIAEWDAIGLAVPRVWVNVSPKQFFRGGLESKLVQATEAYNVMPNRLGLEITETDVLDHRAGDLKPRLFALRDMGYMIALDDFGTGQSSLHYLQELPFDKIKLDRVFVQNLVLGSANELIVSSVVNIAKRCNAVVIAEGVETEEQIIRLLSLGCDRGQGYYYSKPAAASQMGVITNSLTPKLRA